MDQNNGVPQNKSLYQEMEERKRMQEQLEQQRQQANPVPQFDVNKTLTNPMLNQ